MSDSVSLSYTDNQLAQKADLAEHIAGDTLRWQQIADGNAAIYASMVKIAQDVLTGSTPQYDTTKGLTIVGQGGVLTLGGGGTWVAPGNGYLICIFNSVLGGLATVSVNGTEVYNSGLSVLGLKGEPSQPIQVHTNDVVTVAGGLSLGGSFNVTFYPIKVG